MVTVWWVVAASCSELRHIRFSLAKGCGIKGRTEGAQRTGGLCLLCVEVGRPRGPAADSERLCAERVAEAPVGGTAELVPLRVPDSTGDRCLTAVGHDRVAERDSARQSPISESGVAAQITASGEKRRRENRAIRVPRHAPGRSCARTRRSAPRSPPTSRSGVERSSGAYASLFSPARPAGAERSRLELHRRLPVVLPVDPQERGQTPWAPSLRTSAGLGATRHERCRDRVVDLREQADRTGPKPLKLRERLVLRGPYDMGKQSRSSTGGGRGRHFFIYEQSSSSSAAPPSGRFDTAPDPEPSGQRAHAVLIIRLGRGAGRRCLDLWWRWRISYARSVIGLNGSFCANPISTAFRILGPGPDRARR